MKKTLNIISIFIMLVAMFSGVFLVNETEEVVVAATPNKCINATSAFGENGYCMNVDNNGNSVTVTQEGKITIKYKEGVTELLVYAVACGADKKGEDGRSCVGNSWTGKKQIIHLSGNYVRTTYDGRGNKTVIDSKTIHIGDYFDEGELVSISLIYKFIDEKMKFVDQDGISIPKNEDKYKPIYCNADAGIYNCNFTDNKKERTVDKRVKHFITSKLGIAEVSEEYRNINIDYKGNKIVYSGGSDSVNEIVNVDGIMVSVKDTGAENSVSNIQDIIFNTIIPVLWALLGICAAVTIVVLGYQIVKSSDEAEERQQKIKHLRNILIGIAIAAIMLLAAEPLINFVQRYLE